MFRNPPVEVEGSICFSASLVYGFPEHTHPSRKVGRGKLEDIIYDGVLIESTDVEVAFGKNRQSVGSQCLAGLVDKARVVPDLHPDEKVC